MDPGLRVREAFHLHVLRQLAARLAGRPYAVKGGMGLRFFHRSPRLSEDMDFDIGPSLPIPTLQKHVDAVLTGRALLHSLQSQGVGSIEFSRSKQTETTQRWKVGLLVAGVRLSTRLEFSRRKVAHATERGTVRPELLRDAFLPPFVASFYGAAAMGAQKILALASPSRTAARDLFDLHHLFFQTRLSPAVLGPLINPDMLEEAIEKAGRFDYRDFRDQVLPFLPEDLQGLYGNAPAFEQLRHDVQERLKEARA